jgi:Ca2+-binding RTX toxin-like protein
MARGITTGVRRTALLTVVLLLGSSAPAHGARPHLKCMGRWVTLTGTPGDDELRGTKARDVITALAGDDTIDLGKDDVVCGGRGDDTVYGSDHGAEHIHCGPGRDTVYPYNGDDIVRGGKGDDQLVGNFGHDLVMGERGDDVVMGWNGPDDVRGGPGDDQVWGGGDGEYKDRARDSVRGGRGADTIGWLLPLQKLDRRAGRSKGEGRDRFVGVELFNLDR